ncbi:MAG: GNAT family protein [Bacilli bacterium]
MKNCKIIASDGEIDLSLPVDADESETFYDIFLHNTNINVGNISYNDVYRNVFYQGNVGYFIVKQYRGNNYALKALNLLKEELKRLGRSDILLNIYEDNYPSINTAKRFGAKLVCYRKIPEKFKFYFDGIHEKIAVYDYKLEKESKRSIK